MSLTFTFNGVDSADMGIMVRRNEPPPLAPVSLTLEHVPGLAGDLLMGIETQSLGLVIPVWVNARTVASRATIVAWLAPKTPMALVFSSEPDKVYMAVFAGADDLWTAGSATFKFIVPNPVAWAATETITALVTSDADGSPFDTAVTNAGSAPTYPKFVLPFIAPATFCKVSCGDSYVQVGSPVPVDETPFEPRVVIMHDDCSSLSGWGAGTGTVGTMATSGTHFSPKAAGGSFSTGAGWHGPCVRKVLTSPVEDFEATVTVGLDNRTPKGSMALVRVNLLDASHNIVASMRIYDAWAASICNEVVFEAGAKQLLKTRGPQSSSDYINFSGILRISRIGSVWYAKVGRDSTFPGLGSVLLFEQSIPWTETAASADIAEVEVQIAQNATYPVTNTCLVTQVDVIELATPTDTDVPTVALAGDTLTFDHATNTIYRTVPGGTPERYMEHFDFASDFFALPVGPTTVSVATDGTLVAGVVAPYAPVADYQVQDDGTMPDVLLGPSAALTRATTKTVETNGIVLDVAAGKLAVRPRSNGERGYEAIIEEERTNHLLNSDFASGAANAVPTDWTYAGDLTGTPTYSRVAGVYGNTALRVRYTAASGTNKSHILDGGLTAVGSFAPGESVTASAWVTSASTAGIIHVLFIVAYDSGGGYLGLYNGEFLPSTVTTRTRVSGTYTDLPANTSRVRLQLISKAIDTGDVLDVVWDAVDLQKGSIATSHIPTTTAPVTRDGDVLSIPVANWNPAAGTIVAVRGVLATGGVVVGPECTGKEIRLGDLSADNTWLYHPDQTATKNGLPSVPWVNAATWADGTKNAVYINGVGAESADVATAPTSFTGAYIGSVLGTSNFVNGPIQRVVIYDRALTPAEVLAVSTAIVDGPPEVFATETHRDCWS